MLRFHEMGNTVPGLIEEIMNKYGIQEFTVKPFDIEAPPEKD